MLLNILRCSFFFQVSYIIFINLANLYIHEKNEPNLRFGLKVMFFLTVKYYKSTDIKTDHCSKVSWSSYDPKRCTSDLE